MRSHKPSEKVNGDDKIGEKRCSKDSPIQNGAAIPLAEQIGGLQSSAIGRIFGTPSSHHNADTAQTPAVSQKALSYTPVQSMIRPVMIGMTMPGILPMPFWMPIKLPDAF